MSKIGNIVKDVTEVLTSGTQTERLTFRRFDGTELAAAAESGGDVSPTDVVVLKVNPEEIAYTQPKIIQKVQTNAPGNFVIFDWGTDLEVMNIMGNTGNMLPAIIQSGFDPLAGFAKSVAEAISPTEMARRKPPLGGEASAVAANIMMKTMSYYELLDMSPKYRTFKRLKDLYTKFDADMDVLTLEMGDSVLRIFFTSFNFTQRANSPWNWKYSIGVSVLNDLASAIRRGDERFPNNDYLDRSS